MGSDYHFSNYWVNRGGAMSELKCPFCQQKMRRTNGTHNKVGVWQCKNSNDPDNVCIASGYLFNDDVLNYIIRTRKALDVAVDALKISRDCAVITSVARGLEPKEDEINIVVTKALEKITAQEQKDK